LSSDAIIESTFVGQTAPSVFDGAFGDGIAVASLRHEASASIAASHVEASARAGIACFGAQVAVSTTVLECNFVHLDGEIYQETDFWFDDHGDNVCGCDGELVECQVMTSNLRPPESP
jgi:hypothetical protein